MVPAGVELGQLEVGAAELVGDGAADPRRDVMVCVIEVILVIGSRSAGISDNCGIAQRIFIRALQEAVFPRFRLGENRTDQFRDLSGNVSGQTGQVCNA